MMMLVVRMVRGVHMGDTINWEKYFSADKIQHINLRVVAAIKTVLRKKGNSANVFTVAQISIVR